MGRIGFLKALRKYEKSKGAALTTLAWYAILWEILAHIKQEEKHQHKPLFDQEIQYLDQLWELIPNSLTDKEIQVLELKLQGYTFKEIGEKLNCSRGWANKLYHAIIKKIQNANS